MVRKPSRESEATSEEKPTGLERKPKGARNPIEQSG